MTVANHASMALQNGRLVDRPAATTPCMTGSRPANRTMLNQEMVEALGDLADRRSPG